MRFLIGEKFVEEMNGRPFHPPDCYVHDKKYLHHIYLGGVKCVVASALEPCLQEATQADDKIAIEHISLHLSQLENARRFHLSQGGSGDAQMIGDPPPPPDSGATSPPNTFYPKNPQNFADLQISRSMLEELILRVVYNAGRITGIDILNTIRVPVSAVEEILKSMTLDERLAIVGQRGAGDFGMLYEVRPPKGTIAVEEALSKTQYAGPAPVPLHQYVDAIMSQTLRNLVVTRQNVRSAFQDLILSEAVLDEVGPAVNAAASIFLFGYPGNGKTSIAERICRLLGDDMYIPFAIEVDGQIIKVF